jgi:hypothetical protein
MDTTSPVPDKSRKLDGGCNRCAACSEDVQSSMAMHLQQQTQWLLRLLLLLLLLVVLCCCCCCSSAAAAAAPLLLLQLAHPWSPGT